MLNPRNTHLVHSTTISLYDTRGQRERRTGRRIATVWQAAADEPAADVARWVLPREGRGESTRLAVGTAGGCPGRLPQRVRRSSTAMSLSFIRNNQDGGLRR